MAAWYMQPTPSWVPTATPYLDEVILGVAGAKGPLEKQDQAFWGPLHLQQLVVLLGIQVDLPLLVTPGVLQRQALGSRHEGAQDGPIHKGRGHSPAELCVHCQLSWGCWASVPVDLRVLPGLGASLTPSMSISAWRQWS